MKSDMLLFTLLLILSTFNFGQDINQILEEYGDSTVTSILEQHQKYKVQIVYTKIDRKEDNFAILTTNFLFANNTEYFYPASSVKFPASVVALEKLYDLDIEGLDKYTPLEIDSVYTGQSNVIYDSSSEDTRASIANYIKKILLVSDNDAYNRIYEFCGMDYLNTTLWNKGYKDVRLSHRLSIFLTEDENRHTNPFDFYKDDKVIYSQPAQIAGIKFDKKYENSQLGSGYFSGGELVEEPMDFSGKNYFSLIDQHEILKAVIFPESVAPEKRFHLSDDDYEFLYKYMIYYPREAGHPEYDSTNYPDYYAEFFAFDKSNKNIRTLGKSGLAYGFLIDNAYVVDFGNNIEYLLSATIHVNEDGIYNDDKYEYKEIGLPFLRKLSEAIYKYELARNRERIPDLSRFRKYHKY